MTKQQEPKQPESNSSSSFLFQVEILIEDNHHTTALEQLIHQLNQNKFSDYRITSGIQLGEKIERVLHSAEVHQDVPVTLAPETKADSESKDISDNEGLGQIRVFMKNKSLIRLIVNRGFGVKMNIPCRIINIDDSDHLITVYHVDEKQVYTFRLNEIEDFIP